MPHVHVNCRLLEVLGFSPSSKSLNVLFEASPIELDVFHGIPCFAKLSGDVAVTYTEGNAIISFWMEGRSVVITEVRFGFVYVQTDFLLSPGHLRRNGDRR